MPKSNHTYLKNLHWSVAPLDVYQYAKNELNISNFSWVIEVYWNLIDWDRNGAHLGMPNLTQAEKKQQKTISNYTF